MRSSANDRPVPEIEPALLDRLLSPLHALVWRTPQRRAHKLLGFAETEADGGRDLCRAAELCRDPLLRRLYLRHAMDEQRHAELFRLRGRAILAGLPREARGRPFQPAWIAPGERGIDDLRVESEEAGSLLAFLHLSEKAAASRFSAYREILRAVRDEDTRDVFQHVLRDEAFHMNYTYRQLQRISPARHRRHLYRARAGRLWRAYLRAMAAIAGVLGGLMLIIQYFVLLPPFALLARRAARREPLGFVSIDSHKKKGSLRQQY